MTLPFTEQLETLPPSPDWLAELRQQAAASFRKTGLPSPRDESWKYTNLQSVIASFPQTLSRNSNIVSGNSVAIPEALVSGSARAIFIDGIFREDLSDIQNWSKNGGMWDMAGDLDAGVNKDWIGHFELEKKVIGALNTALFIDGLRIISPFGEDIERPLEICFIGTPNSNWHAKLEVFVNPDTSMTLIERHIGSGNFFSTVVSEIRVQEGSTLQHYRLQETSPDAVVLAVSGVEIEQSAVYDAFSLTTGGRLSRHEIRADLVEHDAEVRLNGAHILSGSAHCDTTTEIRHLYPNGRSRETYRHVMDGTSRSVFQGKIFVAEGAQKTDGFQLNQSLMLSPTAEVNAKPELEIYADDVKCSHGATSGRLDAEALFYLRSRGIPAAAAKQMLIEAFIGSSIDLIEDEAVRDAFRAHAASVLYAGEVES